MADINANDFHKTSEIFMTFREQFLENIKSLYEAKQLCDVTLIADERRIPAHRIILSAATPYFAAMFTNEMKEKNQHEIILYEIHGNELKALIDFCYTGFIDINETNVFEMLETASRIEFTLIENTCARFLRDTLNVSNCLLIWTITEFFINLNELTEMALKFIEENFVEVAETRDFLLLDVNHLSTLLISDGLDVYSEEEVFDALSKWVNYDRNNRKCHVRSLLKTIRFSQLKLKFLLENVSQFCEDSLRDLVYHWPQHELPASPRPSTTAKRIIAIGNESSSSSENCGEIYSLLTNRWKILDELRCERRGFCSVVLGNEIFILGGFCQKRMENMKSVIKYDFLTKQLREGEPMIGERAYHAATVFNNKIFAAGGSGLDSMEKFDPENGEWSKVANMLQIRRYFALVSLNDRLYAVGGRVNFKEDLNFVESYDPLKNKWELATPMNRKRCAHSAIVHKNRLFVLGGLAEDSIDDSVEFYDPTIDKWTMIHTFNIPRYGSSVITFEDFVIIAGGRERTNSTHNSSIVKIDIGKLSMENISSINHGKRHLNLVGIPCYNPES